MLEELREGNYQTLSLFYNNTHQGYGGGCRNPWVEAQRAVPLPQRLVQDGCAVSTYTLAGSSHPFMNGSKTAVHEIGHWLGLFHPFEDGGIRASPSAPPPRTPAGSRTQTITSPIPPKTYQGLARHCDKTSNTCGRFAEGDYPIYDPVENYMMYTSDDCQFAVY